jgi:hypothetical protein
MPTTTTKDRKRILRMILEDITVFAEARNPNLRLGIRWRNKCWEEISATKPLPIGLATKHTQETIELIRKLSLTMTDIQITEHFNKMELLKPDGKTFTLDSIKWIRYLHKIPGFFKQKKAMSVKEVAELLSVSTGVVHYWINNGILIAEKLYPGWPWEIRLDKEKELELRERIKSSSHLV